MQSVRQFRNPYCALADIYYCVNVRLFETPKTGSATNDKSIQLFHLNNEQLHLIDLFG